MTDDPRIQLLETLTGEDLIEHNAAIASGLQPIDPSKPMHTNRMPTAADILRFWEEKGARTDCELCGRVDWRLTNERGRFMLNIPHGPFIRRTGVALTLDGAMTLFHAICQNCGNLRLIHHIPLFSWLRNIRLDW